MCPTPEDQFFCEVFLAGRVMEIEISQALAEYRPGEFYAR